MQSEIIRKIYSEMNSHLDSLQLKRLIDVLEYNLNSYEIKTKCAKITDNKIDYCDLFLNSKKLEGCSTKTIKFYKTTIECMIKIIDTDIRLIDTNDIRKFLKKYQAQKHFGKVTL